MNEIWITAVGIVSPLGIGREAVEESLRERKSGVGPITLFETEGYPVRQGGEVRDFRARDLVRNRKSLKISRRNIHLALAAGNLAWNEAELEGRVAPERAGVVMSAGRLGATLEEICPAMREAMDENGEVDLARYAETSARIMPPYWFLRHIPNLVPGTVAIDLGLKAPSNTICVGGIGSLLALEEAAAILERGDADVMLAGGADCLVDPYHVVTHHQLGRIDLDSPDGPRPFRADSKGTVLGETGAVVVLERSEFAEARGRTPLAVWEAFESGRPSPEATSRRTGANPNENPKATLLGGTGLRELDALEVALADPGSALSCYRDRTGWMGSSTGVHDLVCAILEARALGSISPAPSEGGMRIDEDRWRSAPLQSGDRFSVQTLSWGGAYAAALLRIP